MNMETKSMSVGTLGFTPYLAIAGLCRYSCMHFQ